MGDVVFVVMTVAFFALCALYIRGCERIVQSGEEAADGVVDGVADGSGDLVEEVAR